MSVGSFLVRARARRELLMRATGEVTRKSAGQVFDPATGLYEPAETTTVYSGKLEIQHAYSPSDRSVDVETEVQTRVYNVLIPFDAPVVQTDDLLIVTATVDNQWVVGVPLRVVKTEYGLNRTAQRFSVLAQDHEGGEYGGRAR